VIFVRWMDEIDSHLLLFLRVIQSGNEMKSILFIKSTFTYIIIIGLIFGWFTKGWNSITFEERVACLFVILQNSFSIVQSCHNCNFELVSNRSDFS
jgi:hypothetical protein